MIDYSFTWPKLILTKLPTQWVCGSNLVLFPSYPTPTPEKQNLFILVTIFNVLKNFF